jgi:hypothetical protein
MNKTLFWGTALLLLFVCCVCTALYIHTPHIEVEPKAVASSSTEEDIIVIYRQRVDGHTSDMRVLHDNKRNVTCWKLCNGLSCIPDYMLEETKR